MRHRHFTFLSLMIIPIITLTAYYLNDTPEKRLVIAIEKYLKDGNFGYTGAGVVEPGGQGDSATPYEEIYFYSALKLLSEKYGKHFESININKPIDDESINIYLLDKDPQSLFVDFKGNCAYVGYRNIIICDLNYLFEIQNVDYWRTDPKLEIEHPGWLKDSNGRLKPPSDMPKDGPQTEEEVAQLFMGAGRAMDMSIIYWILGHEIGHIANDHRNRHYTFEGNSSSLLIKNFDGQGTAEEREADEFAVKAGGPATSWWFYSSINSFIERYLHPKDKSQSRVSLQDGKYIVKADSKTHPPLFFRAVEMSRLLNEEYQLESPPFYSYLYNRVVVKQ
jgi:hypothetical protein